jgi:hypothetical protein
MKAKQIAVRYKRMLAINGDPVDPNRINCYRCQVCQAITKTIDIDRGVIPFMHRCEFCGGTAYSSFFDDIAPAIKPTQEWYRPTLKQVLKMKNEGLIEHILMGGLDVRKISPTPEEQP